MARGLARNGHSVTVISTRSPLGKAEVQREGVTAYYLQEGGSQYSGMTFAEAAYQKFLELHRQQPFHIVHSLDDSGKRIGRNKKNLGIAIAYDVEATQMSQLFSILGMGQESAASLLNTYLALGYKFLTTYLGKDRKLLRSANGVFVSHPLQRVILERYYLYPDYHIYSVPYGAELNAFTSKDDPRELQKRFGLPEQAQTAVTISDMMDSRELIPLLRAFEKVAIKKPNAYLVIAGTGPQFKKVEREVLDLALGSRVILTGALKANEILDLIMVGDVFINLSSRSTGFEPNLIEAMAQKKIVIGSEVSPVSNVIEDGQDGFLIRPADVENLSLLLMEIFMGDLNTQDIGDRAQKKVLDLFDPKKIAALATNAYRKILINTGQFKDA